MPKIKIKTHSSSKKRFKITGTGKVKMQRACKRHYLNHKSPKSKRNPDKSCIVDKTLASTVKKMIPYM